MEKEQELDELISKYTDDLIKLKDKWAKWGIQTESKTPEAAEETKEKDADAVSESVNSNENEAKDQENTASSSEENKPAADPENFAYFRAKVFSGRQAYPVAKAKISVYRDAELYLFLITDENGETKKARLQSYPALNAFIAESPDQRLDYSADIYADGFAPQKNLLVSAVGSSDILLTAEMIPLPERTD